MTATYERVIRKKLRGVGMTKVYGVTEDGKRELLVVWDEHDRGRNEQMFRQSIFDACLGRDDIVDVFMIDIEILVPNKFPEARELGARCIHLDDSIIILESRCKASGWQACFADGKTAWVEGTG